MWYIFENDEQQLIFDTATDNDPRLNMANNNWTRGSRAYPSKEALFEGNRILPEPCVICRRWIISTYHNRASLVAKNMCFGCDLWHERAQVMHQPKHMIVNAQWYSILPDTTSNTFRGFGGRKFVFQRLEDAAIVESHNVWSGGAVPAVWRPLIKDTAILKKDVDTLNLDKITL